MSGRERGNEDRKVVVTWLWEHLSIQQCVICIAAVKFLSALAADGTIPDVEGIISSNLSTAFDSLKQNVTDSMAHQEKTLAAVQVGEIFTFKS